MYETPQEALRAIEALGLPKAVTDVWNDAGPTRFRRQYRAPVRYFTMADDLLSRNPSADHYIPIFEVNGEKLYAFDTRAGKFVEYYYEDETATAIGADYQQFIGWIFVDLGYAGLDSIVDEVADLFEFKSMPKLREFMEQDDESSAADAKREFVDGLGREIRRVVR